MDHAGAVADINKTETGSCFALLLMIFEKGLLEMCVTFTGTQTF